MPKKASTGFSVTVDYDDYSRLAAALANVKTASILLVYRDFYRYFREILRERYDRASRETPYSPQWKGTVQAYSGRVRGEDALYGIDSGALYRDLTNNVKITSGGIEVYSDQEYASRMMDLFAQKGPYAPYGLWTMEAEDVDQLEEILEARMVQFLGITPPG
jgi:hypothetical protein